MADEAHKEYKADVNANKEKFELPPATEEEKTRFKCVHPQHENFPPFVGPRVLYSPSD